MMQSSPIFYVVKFGQRDFLGRTASSLLIKRKPCIIYPYALHFIVRQFGFSQTIPALIALEPKGQICNSVVTSFDELQAWFEDNDVKGKNSFL